MARQKVGRRWECPSCKSALVVTNAGFSQFQYPGSLGSRLVEEPILFCFRCNRKFGPYKSKLRVGNAMWAIFDSPENLTNEIKIEILKLRITLLEMVEPCWLGDCSGDTYSMCHVGAPYYSSHPCDEWDEWNKKMWVLRDEYWHYLGVYKRSVDEIIETGYDVSDFPHVDGEPNTISSEMIDFELDEETMDNLLGVGQ